MANGTTLKSWPSWPDMPVSWVSSGTRAGANQIGISRITEMNVMASPGAHQDAAQHAAGDVLGERQLELAQPHQQGAAGDHGPGAETVHEDADRNLQRRHRPGAAAR